MTVLNRRAFLTRTGACLAYAPVSSSLFGQPKYLFPAGIQLYAVREPLAADAPGTLKALADIGYREVETAGFDKYTASQFKQMCDAVGITVPSAHLPFQTATDIPALFAQAVQLEAQFAVSSYLVDLSGLGKSTKPIAEQPAMAPQGLSGFRRMAARMNEFGKLGKAGGVQYAHHNHNFEFERLPDGRFGYDVLLAETDPALVKFEIDCGWMTIGGADPIHYLTQYPDRIRMIHVKDFKAMTHSTSLFGPNLPVGVELGRGVIDYRPILAAAKKAGVLHAFAEQEAPYSRSQLESAKVSYDYLRSVETTG